LIVAVEGVSTMYNARLARTLAAIGVVTIAGLGTAGPASAQAEAPAGNNGTIKIDDVPMDDGNENVPHPGCTFVVDFFGYDVGTRTASLVFEGQEPTGGGELLVDAFTFDVETREGGNQLDASRTVDLSEALVGIEPHPQQGWHVKLTVHVDGAQGADVKHKVFWVSECTSPVLVEAQAAAVNRAAVAAWGAAEQANIERAAVAAWGAAEQANIVRAAQQAQAVAARGQAEAPTAAAAELPRTGVMSGVLAGLAFLLIGSGWALVTWSARKRNGIA
jgi:hypothetical protein